MSTTGTQRTGPGGLADLLATLGRGWVRDSPLPWGKPRAARALNAYLRDHPAPTERELREVLSGHLCRCTGYAPILRAALDAAERLRRETTDA